MPSRPPWDVAYPIREYDDERWCSECGNYIATTVAEFADVDVFDCPDCGEQNVIHGEDG